MNSDPSSSFSYNYRIPHLENNSYIYGEAPQFSSVNFSPIPKEHVRDSVEEQIKAKEELSPYKHSPEHFTRIEDQLFDQEIERRIAEKEQYWSQRSADLRESWSKLRMQELDNQRPNSSRTLLKKSNPGSARSLSKKRTKYSHMNNIYSKYNTKSPYAKSTFAHDVRSMENKPYTYSISKPTKTSHTKQTHRSPKSKDKFIKEVLKLLKSHSEKCPELKNQLAKIQRRTLPLNSPFKFN